MYLGSLIVGIPISAPPHAPRLPIRLFHTFSLSPPIFWERIVHDIYSLGDSLSHFFPINWLEPLCLNPLIPGAVGLTFFPA